MALEQVAYQYEKGNNFRLFIDKEELKKEILDSAWRLTDDLEEDVDEDKVLEGNADYKKAMEIFDWPEEKWAELIAKIARKKNGTFHRNSVTPVVSMREFGYDAEEWWGFRYPEIRIKPASDLEAHVELFWTVDKW